MALTRETIVVYHPTLVARYMALLAPRFPDLAFIPAADRVSAGEAIASAEILLANITFPGPLLDQAPRLGWVQVMGAGVDALAPFVPCGVRLSRLTGSLGPRMAEYAIGYILAITQRVPEVLRNQAAHHWEPLALEVARGKTLGVAGLGSVGGAVAKLGAAVGMRVIGCSRQPRGLDGLDAWFSPDDFGAFLGEADFVVLALPATPETRQIMRRETLARMRPGAWLLNISRGSLVDEPALIAALRRGRPAGAVIDVFAEEPLPPTSPFWEMPNVIVTSHQSGAVDPEEVVALFAENLARYRRGDRLVNEVDLARGY